MNCPIDQHYSIWLFIPQIFITFSCNKQPLPLTEIVGELQRGSRLILQQSEATAAHNQGAHFQGTAMWIYNNS